MIYCNTYFVLKKSLRANIRLVIKEIIKKKNKGKPDKTKYFAFYLMLQCKSEKQIYLKYSLPS